MKNKNIKLFFFLLLIIGLKNTGISQTNNFVSYGIEDGLVQSQIYSIVQDNDGHLWIGTIGGINKYDGRTFETFTQKDGLAEDWVTTSFKTKNGDIWFGHWGGGVTLYSVADKKFIDMKLEKNSNYKKITAIFQDKANNMWFGTEDAGVFKYELDNKTATTLSDTTISNNVSSFLQNKDGFLIVGGNKGLAKINTKNNSVVGVLNSIGNLQNISINCIEKTYKNETWLGTDNYGIIRLKGTIDFSSSSNTYNVINTRDGLSSNQIQSLFYDYYGNVWISAKRRGIVQYVLSDDSGDGFSEGYLNLFSNNYELQYNHANTFYEDREHNLWFGTDIGIYKYVGDLFTIYGKKDGLPDNLVWSILNDSKGNTWFSTTNGVAKFKFNSKNLTHHKQESKQRKGKKTDDENKNNQLVEKYTTANGLPENLVVSMFEDSKGNVWFGTENEGMALLDQKTNKITVYNIENGLADNNVFSINEDAEGNIWAGTKQGASKIDVKTGKVTNYNASNGLGGERVYHLFKDSKGNLWFGILGGALTKYKDGQFTTFSKQEGVTSNYIISIAEDANNNLWMAAYGDGIIKYDGKKFTTYNTSNGLSSNSPLFITTEKDIVWIGMNLGLEKFDPKENQFTLYSRKKGFFGLETNGNAISFDQNNNLWFSSIRGAVKFSPYKDKINPIKPVLYFSGLKIYLDEVELEDNASFNYKQNYLTFKATGISLTNPSAVRYKFKLDGFDKDWLPLTQENKITYSNLPYGKYTLNVLAYNNDGIGAETPVTYSFEITPPFWVTWWFYSVCGALVLAIVVTYIKIRERKLKQQQKFLESEVEKRTEELVEEKKVVEEKSAIISVKNKNITDSINYAKGIQEAILTSANDIKRCFPESFVFYKPKAIVSGDFYWISKTEDRIMFAAIDCTGHGVPGAFTSILGNNVLAHITHENPTASPAEILDLLNKEITNTFNSSTAEETSIKGGMDLSFCILNTKTNTLSFAGAHNPLYLVRNKELTEVKGSKVHVGSEAIHKKQVFENHTIKVQENDMLYLFSDGFADQKGGVKGKKYYYPPFQKLLGSISQQSTKEQYVSIEKEFNSWKKDKEQIDDVLVLGIKIKG